MVDVGADLVELDHQPGLGGQLRRGGEVLAVLPTAGVGGVGTRDDGDQPLHPLGAAPRASASAVKGVKLRLPQTTRRRDLAPVQLGAQGRQQGAVLVVDRAAAAEAVVVLADLLEPFVRDVLARP